MGRHGQQAISDRRSNRSRCLGMGWVKTTVAPGLETKVGVSSELHWVAVPGTKRGTKICEASLQVKVNNPGKSPFDVEKATVMGWLVPLKENGLFPTDASDPKAVSPGKVSLLKYFRSEEHTSELQSPMYLVCRLLLEKKK